MARQKRLYFNNVVYHTSIRGNNKQAILGLDGDKKLFLATLKKFKSRLNFVLYAFVLMNNHAHLIIKADSRNNISKIMQAITLSYSQKFRRKYNYTGYVWQGRFRSNIIDTEDYIIDCINYIHNNPVRANVVKNIEDYLWSSHHFYNNQDNNPMKEYLEIERWGIG